MSVVLGMDFSNFDSVVSQEVLNNKGTPITSAEELEHFSVVVQELLLGGNFATSEFLFEILKHEGVSFWRYGHL